MTDPLRVPGTPFSPKSARKLNASGVVHLGERRFAFIDNRNGRAVYELVLDDDGEQDGDVVQRDLTGIGKKALRDPEGIAMVPVDGEPQLVIVASGARGEGPALVTVRFAPDGDLQAEIMPGFGDWFVEQYPDLADAAVTDAEDGGLNIEGLTWDSTRSDLVLGLRSPVAPPSVTVLRLGLDTSVPWTCEALSAGAVQRVTAPSPGQGIRGMSYDEAREEFLILFGRSRSGEKLPFELGVWDGAGTSTTPLPVEFAGSMKPEGIALFGDREVLVVDDDGGFAVFHAAAVPGWK